MDSLFQNSYYKYFLWNDGLIDYYLSDKSGQEIMLYVDDRILNEIARKIGINTTDSKNEFESCVISFCNNYTTYLGQTIMCPLSQKNKGNEKGQKSKRKCKKWYQESSCWGCENCKSCKFNICVKDRSDILAVANHVKDLKYYKRNESKGIEKNNGEAITQRLPFFAIIIYVILNFDNGSTQQWENIIGIKNPSRSFINDLWNTINKFNVKFDNTASIFNREEDQRNDYVGKIRYHLPLSAPLRNKINDTIYKSGIWRTKDYISFTEIVGRLSRQLENTRYNKELGDILHRCLTNEDYRGIYARKIQTIVDSFNYDEYVANLEERKKTDDYKQTKIKGVFVLAYSIPEDYEEGNPSIQLMTDVHQAIASKELEIKEGTSDTIDIYNINFVEVKGDKPVEIKSYTLKNEECNIKSMPIDDVVFLYEYYHTLYIQTRILRPANSYLILVKNSDEVMQKFEAWCEENDNEIRKNPIERTQDIFGKKWVVYYSNRTLNGQYYTEEQNINNGNPIIASKSIIRKSGITNKDGKYFIQSLPCFEMPESFDNDNLSIYLSLVDYQKADNCDSYRSIIHKNKLIIDLPDNTPITEGLKVNIKLELPNNVEHVSSFEICGQNICYDVEKLYKYDSLGRLSFDDYQYAICGNRIDNAASPSYKLSYTRIHDKYTGIDDDMYLVNLLAACCYDNNRVEISNDRFKDILSYAAIRLGIEIQHKDYIKNVKRLLETAGYVNLDHSRGTCQIIPPAFTKMPPSLSTGRSKILLTGCYTRKFMLDLMEYCKSKDVKIYKKGFELDDYYKGILPPMILLQFHFDADEFVRKYHHQCDVLNEQDISFSLLSQSATVSEAFKKFEFSKVSESDLLLEPTQNPLLPRIRKDKNRHNTHWYIEKEGQLFAHLDKSLIPWAILYCMSRQTGIIAVLDTYNLYIQAKVSLPMIIRRSLYLMNCGLPTKKKAFVCGNKTNNYYTIMDYYELYSEDRANLFAEKMGSSEDDMCLIRNRIGCEKYQMEYWISETDTNINRNIFLVLYKEEKRIAIGHKSSAYYVDRKKDVLYEIKGNMNEVLSSFMTGEWKKEDGHLNYYEGEKLLDSRELSESTFPNPKMDTFIRESLIIL